MAAEYKYRAFISYSHKDEKWASWLHKALETFKVPRYLHGQETPMGTVPERMGKVFRDREELSSSHSLGTELTQALSDSIGRSRTVSGKSFVFRTSRKNLSTLARDSWLTPLHTRQKSRIEAT